MHEDNCFLTLTYDENSCPKDHSLSVRDIQLFCKKLRKKNREVPVLSRRRIWKHNW